MYKDLRVLFVGIPDMAYVCLDGMVKAGINIVGVVGPKKTHNTYQAFRTFVKQRNLNFIEFDDLEDEGFINNIRALNADIAVVCSFNYKVPKVMLDSVKGGFINTHPALLPDYRGANPYSAVIINNEKYTGVTLHMMDEDFDTGDIVLQRKLEIQDNDTMGTLFNKQNQLGLEMLLEALELYSKGEMIRTPQAKGEFKSANKIKSNIINFEQDAESVERFIRGLNPFILAKTYFRGFPLTVFTAEVDKSKADKNLPCGAIAKVTKDRFYIKTKDGLIAPTSIQFGGFFVSTAKEFVAIVNPQVGEVMKGNIFG